MSDRIFVDRVVEVVWLLVALGEVATLITFFRRRLMGDYKVFCVYLTGILFRSIALRLLGGTASSPAYRTVWMATEPFFLVIQAWVVFEFHRLLYRAYPGIHAFARVLLLVAIGVALLVTFGTVQLDVGRIVWRAPDLQRLIVVRRVVASLLGILLLTTMAFFPKAPSTSNIRLHGWLLSVFFLAAACGAFGLNYGLAGPWMAALFLSVQIGCFALWSLLLRPAYVRGPRPTPEAVARTERWNDDFLALAKWLVG